MTRRLPLFYPSRADEPDMERRLLMAIARSNAELLRLIGWAK